MYSHKFPVFLEARKAAYIHLPSPPSCPAPRSWRRVGARVDLSSPPHTCKQTMARREGQPPAFPSSYWLGATLQRPLHSQRGARDTHASSLTGTLDTGTDCSR
ncbi:hypothetical protein E2C01_062450 [Portunus trituberculatus]|uniref:Uncharacterized protein n=1 Tax=Portunus trituberculatus TaxID=210409 RepID=A0A5B7HDP5_PORTR|nr:hypothetical protein [Portunus trituberculatus]